MNIPILLMVPFVIMLLCIAVMPIVAENYWHDNKNKLYISLSLSVPVLAWFILQGDLFHLEEAILYDYVPFIILLGGLFVVSGGILIEVKHHPTPLTNLVILAVGGLIASFVGTTGAAMLLIRPVLKINEKRKHKVHIFLFFIAIVANCGGLLTPLGDPPLFMMYLRGAEFSWFMGLLPEWAIMLAALLVLFYFKDKVAYGKENEDMKRAAMKVTGKVKIHGFHNFLFLAGIVFAVAYINPNNMEIIRAGEPSSFIREAFILLMSILSLVLTRKGIYRRNHFNWEPIKEVAYLFIGIFITMVPVLIYLKLHAKSIGVTHPTHFYYATGILSAFLDNTPTAVTFHSLAQGLVSGADNHVLVAGIPDLTLKVISTASVFFGAMTYIGNGPNFMVKSIVENSGVKMPHFFAYMYRFSIIVLLPLFIFIQIVCL